MSGDGDHVSVTEGDAAAAVDNGEDDNRDREEASIDWGYRATATRRESECVAGYLGGTRQCVSHPLDPDQTGVEVRSRLGGGEWYNYLTGTFESKTLGEHEMVHDCDTGEDDRVLKSVDYVSHSTDIRRCEVLVGEVEAE